MIASACQFQPAESHSQDRVEIRWLTEGHDGGEDEQENAVSVQDES